jgi:hypothetical protein
MSIVGKYCRGFPLGKLRQFPGWTEKAEEARKIRMEVDGEIVEEARKLTDEDYVYLQMNYTVTDGIFVDENIIFSDVTPEWIGFCQNGLGQRPSVAARLGVGPGSAR